MALTGMQIPAELVVDLDEISPGVHGLRIMFVNVFVIEDAAGWLLVDAGLRGWSGHIRRWAERHFDMQPPHAIVLTHGHFDHVGGLADLATEWRVPVYAHADEVAYLRGERDYPPPDPSVGGGLMASLSGLYPSSVGPFHGELLALPEDGTIPFAPSWRWLPTPGHSAGHVSFFRDTDRTVVVGDAFCTTKQESVFAVTLQEPELHGPPAYFTSDWRAAQQSVRLLAGLRPQHIAPGHGPALKGSEVSVALDRLAADFDRLAVPDRGRYVSTPVRG